MIRIAARAKIAPKIAPNTVRLFERAMPLLATGVVVAATAEVEVDADGTGRGETTEIEGESGC